MADKMLIFPGLLGTAMLMASVVAAQTPPAASALPEGPGKAETETACTACHDITQVTSQRRTTAQWTDTIDQMIARGAQVSDDDSELIAKYLGKNFAPAAASTSAAARPAVRTSSNS